MITISNLRLQRGTKVLLDKVNARIDTGQKVGLVGRNGTGKSSLFALMRGELLAAHCTQWLDDAQAAVEGSDDS